MEPHFERINFTLKELTQGAQLVAIRDLLNRQERADRELSDRIEEADEVARRARGRANEHAVDVWVELRKCPVIGMRPIAWRRLACLPLVIKDCRVSK